MGSDSTTPTPQSCQGCGVDKPDLRLLNFHDTDSTKMGSNPTALSRECLVDEQLCYKERMFLMSFGTDVSCPWEYPQDINIRVLHEARQWIQEMQPRGGCNLLLALRKTLQIQELDTLVVIVSNCYFSFIYPITVGHSNVSALK
ncbi:unnamed protein product [Ranitomeya imitator]|uniref:VWFA domain-containing protein n=1 Tax=Ranitomeya imitator TaxID=111125 RepID=A0ABN9LG71_9NEOB|nr:unnamed protein product [Ranitomeya imitator]